MIQFEREKVRIPNVHMFTCSHEGLKNFDKYNN